MNDQKVLITGATGFLGRHLTKDLINKGFQVSILARKTSDLSPFKNSQVRVVHGDITNRLSLLQATEDQDYVFHLAGFIAYKKKDRKMMDKINVEGTAAVIDACITNNIKKLLHLSSVVTIGASPTPRVLNEDHAFNLSSFNLGYFETKRKAEQLIQQAYENDGLKAYMINPATIYGEGDATKGSRKTQIKVAQGNFKFYPPGGVNVVYIKDVIQAIHLCLEKGEPARRYIIGGENLTLKNLFEILADEAGVPPPTIPIPRTLMKSLGWIGDRLKKLGYETSMTSETAVTASYYHWFSNQRAMEELGFQPTAARTAIKESVSWMKENGYLEKPSK